jgi:hypothetical protein
LRRTTRAAADILIHVVATPPGHVMRETGVPKLDGNPLGLARVALRTRDGEIREALIAVSAFAPQAEVASVMLEELVQAMGLMTDIAGPGQAGSLFAERGNAVTRLAGQDATALRRHYGREPEGS